MEPTSTDLNVRPDELAQVVMALRGVRDVVVVPPTESMPAKVQVLVDGQSTEQPHWLELLHRSVQLLSNSAFGSPVDVVVLPHDADLDASLDK